MKVKNTLNQQTKKSTRFGLCEGKLCVIVVLWYILRKPNKLRDTQNLGKLLGLLKISSHQGKTLFPVVVLNI